MAGGSVTATDQNKGAEDLSLYGGKIGKVPFPHHKHQAALGDCMICHDLYSQEPGIIEELKRNQTLKKKQVMNKQCTKCHREKKKAGAKTGPTTCKSCHVK
jgi:hypothetical protein